MSKSKLRQIAAQQGGKSVEGHTLNLRDAALLGVRNGQRHPEKPYVNLKYYTPSHECLSDWERVKLQAFSKFCTQITRMSWIEIYQSGGSVGNKTGLGYTVHKDHSKLPSNSDLSDVSPDLTWFELRVDRESRVHGFRVQDAFFLVFLDKNHQIYPS